MSSNASNTRNTVASAHSRMDEIEANLDARFDRLESLLGAIVGTPTVEPVKTTKAKAKAGKSKTTKAAAPKAKKVETPEVAAKRASYSNFRNLREALRAHKAAGAIKAGLTVAQAIEQGLMNDDGSLPGGKKAAKASAKATAPQVTAKVKATDTAKVVPSRRANGTIAPKGEWAIREALKAQGKTPKQVDKATAKAMKVLNG